MTTIFVTSSGTEIGKTFVTVMLLRQLRGAGHSCDALKPIVSGFAPDDAAASDPGQLLSAMGRAIDATGLDAISPWRFAAPLSPDMAARRENRAIAYEDLLEFCSAAFATDVTLIEGVGGVMAPVGDGHTVLDWISDLGTPALLVVGSYLGSISHTLTAVEALRGRGIELAGIVINESDDEPVATQETAATIARFLSDTACIVLPKKKAGADLSTPDLLPLISTYLNRS